MRGFEPSSRGREQQGRQILVERFSTSVTRSSLMSATAAEKSFQKSRSTSLPRELAVGNLVELLLKGGGEIVLDIFLEEALQERRDERPREWGINLRLSMTTYSRSASVFEGRRRR